MTLGGILILLLLLVSLIVFIYIVVITARGWGVLHTILLCFLFIECWVFLLFSAGVQYQRVRFTEQAAKNKEAAEKALGETQRLLWGTLSANNLNLEAVVPVKGLLRRMTADRGRVWRAVTYMQSNGTDFQLELSGNAPDVALDVDADAAAQPTSESLPVDLVVYAFAEELDDENRPIPVFYLGEFKVSQSQNGSVTLAPTLALQKSQTDFVASGAASSWTLYELLPLDSHTAFAAPGSQTNDEAIFGRMDEDSLRTLFANVPTEDGQQDKIVDQYRRDGTQADENDPPESLWVQVNVLKNYEVLVDSDEVADATERGYFDINGRSIDIRLKSGKEEGRVVLTPDMKELIVLKEEAARPLIANGTLAKVRPFFVRPLIDYEEAFNKLFVRVHEITEAITLFRRESSEIDKANQLGQEMIGFRQVENQKLTSDLQNYQREVQVLTASVSEAEGALASLKSELSELYRMLQARSAQLTATGR